MPFTLPAGSDVVEETEVKHSRFIAALRRVDSPRMRRPSSTSSGGSIRTLGTTAGRT